MLNCTIWFSAPSFWMGGGLENRCVGRVYGADGAVRRSVTTCHKWAFSYDIPVSTPVVVSLSATLRM